MTNTIETWKNIEKTVFDNFTDFVSARLEEAINRAICERLRLDMHDGKTESSVIVPWGTFSAELKVVGEGSNISPSFEPSKVFLKMIDVDDINRTNVKDRQQDEFDAKFMELFKEYTAYGDFYLSKEDRANKVAVKERGLKMMDEEACYFLNEYAVVLATIAHEQYRPGKIYDLDVGTDETFHLGTYVFEFAPEGVKVRLVFNKAFKQELKNDSATRKYIADTQVNEPINFAEAKAQREKSEEELAAEKKFNEGESTVVVAAFPGAYFMLRARDNKKYKEIMAMNRCTLY